MIAGSESCFLSFVSTVSVIIPTLNEADRIGDTLFALERTLVHEVIVVDAGSEDATREIAAESECRLVTTDRPGRAAQLNLGASESEGTILLFLHADTVVPLLSIKHMKYAMDRADGFVGGGFARRFDSRSPFLAVTTRLAGLRSRLFGLFLGDQGIFVRRDAFRGKSGRLLPGPSVGLARGALEPLRTMVGRRSFPRTCWTRSSRCRITCS